MGSGFFGGFFPGGAGAAAVIAPGATALGALTVVGALRTNSTLTADGASTLTGDATASGTLTVTGNTTCNGHLTMGSGKQVYLDPGSSSAPGLAFVGTTNSGVKIDSGNPTLIRDGSIQQTWGSSNITMGSLVTFEARTVENLTAAVTASTTQTQGQAAQLFNNVNVSVCANANDVITLQAAAAGAWHLISNSGAQTLQIFPASGDAIDGGSADASTTLAAGAEVYFKALDATNWKKYAL